LIMNLVRLLAIVALMTWFFSHFNLMGPVILTVGGILLAKAMSIARIKTLLRTSYGQVLPWKTLGSVLCVAVLSAVPCVLLNSGLAVHALVLLPISGMLYLCTFIVLVVGFGLLEDAEKAAIKRTLVAWSRGIGPLARQAGLGR
jgi:hypothetical protein